MFLARLTSKLTYNLDIQENEILALSPRLLTELLKDHSATRAAFSADEVAQGKQVNIFWATDIYQKRYGTGLGYDYHDPITIEKITGENGNVIRPRVSKSRDEQLQRSRDKAEVFTPSWICNKQNNLVDNAWFGCEHVFNTEIDTDDGTHNWQPTESPISFPDNPAKTWQHYVSDNRLEITCGEAPYLASRYDTITGITIPLVERIGLLDRKLRVVSENVDDAKRWWYYAQRAYQSIYGYDWQGDNVLLAREALFFTFIEYYQAKFCTMPSLSHMQKIAYIISWNIWQMDGLKFVIPDSCHAEVAPRVGVLFGDIRPTSTTLCKGCLTGKAHLHNGIHCLVRDWSTSDKSTGKRWTDLPFFKLLTPIVQ